jgi:hypothetical protein
VKDLLVQVILQHHQRHLLASIGFLHLHIDHMILHHRHRLQQEVHQQ